jgi:hypothetical protein
VWGGNILGIELDSTLSRGEHLDRRDGGLISKFSGNIVKRGHPPGRRRVEVADIASYSGKDGPVRGKSPTTDRTTDARVRG